MPKGLEQGSPEVKVQRGGLQPAEATGANIVETMEWMESAGEERRGHSARVIHREKNKSSEAACTVSAWNLMSCQPQSKPACGLTATPHSSFPGD